MDGNNGDSHPVTPFIRTDVLPPYLCSGCGIGIVVNTFLQAARKTELDTDRLCAVSSGIGCTGKVAGQFDFKVYDATDGNAIVFAAKLAVEEPDRKVVIFLNDTDLIASGIESFIRAGKENARILVMYINNYIYRILMEHKELPNTPFSHNSSNSAAASPTNIPHLAASSGAAYVARWTPLHVRRLMFSITEALSVDGLSIIEVISPCLMFYGSDGKVGRILDRMEYFYQNSVIRHHEPTENLDLGDCSDIIVGKFLPGVRSNDG